MMKQKFLMIPALAAALFFGSCSSSKNTVVPPARSDVQGNWTLDHISYDGLATGAKYNIGLLDEGSANCLEGSTWNLPGSGFGSYVINATSTDCKPGETKINWSYRMVGNDYYFQFKRLVEGSKAKTVTEGYKLKIVSATKEALQLQSEAISEGKTIYVNYQFSKAKK